jgi:hypothetical protein
MLKKNVYVDHNQGLADGRAFGFVGLYDCDTDTDNYCGWFFTWPGRVARIQSVAERDAVIASLEPDDVCRENRQIPHRWAKAALLAYLRRFDLRRRSLSA